MKVSVYRCSLSKGTPLVVPARLPCPVTTAASPYARTLTLSSTHVVTTVFVPFIPANVLALVAIPRTPIPEESSASRLPRSAASFLRIGRAPVTFHLHEFLLCLLLVHPRDGGEASEEQGQRQHDETCDSLHRNLLQSDNPIHSVGGPWRGRLIRIPVVFLDAATS